MADDISIVESPKQMAVGEAVAWTFNFASIGTPASVSSFLAYDETMTDKSSIVLSGSASISGDVVTGKLFTPASAQEYTLICTVVIGTNTWSSTMLVEVYNPVASITLSNAYATIKELKHYLTPGASQDKYDDEIMAHLIDAASRYIDSETNRKFYSTSATRYYSVPSPSSRWLWLDEDLLTVTTLTNGDTTVLTTSDYYLWPKNNSPYAAIVLKEHSSYYWEGDSNNDTEYVISVAGTWGYSSSTPVAIKQAVLELAGQMYKQRFGENLSATSTITAAGLVVTPQDISYKVQKLIEYYRKIV